MELDLTDPEMWIMRDVGGRWAGISKILKLTFLTWTTFLGPSSCSSGAPVVSCHSLTVQLSAVTAVSPCSCTAVTGHACPDSVLAADSFLTEM